MEFAFQSMGLGVGFSVDSLSIYALAVVALGYFAGKFYFGGRG